MKIRLCVLIFSITVVFYDCKVGNSPCVYNDQYNIHKSGPLQAWSGSECSRKLKFPDFVTTAQDGGKVVSLTHRPPLPPGNTPGTHLC